MTTGSGAAVAFRRAIAAAALLLILGVVPARALEAKYDGAYSVLPADRGIVLVELIGGGQARVTLALMNLAPNADYSLLWSKARCGRSSSANQAVLELALTTNGAGAAFRAEVVPWLWATTAPVPQSARLARVGGSGKACARANAFGDANGDGSVSGTDYALFSNGTRRGLIVLERQGNTTGRLSWSLSGLKPGRTYRLMATTAGCSGAPNVSNRLFSVSFVAPVSGIHAEKNQDVEVENDETHWVGHDFRAREVGGPEWGCRNAAVTDLIIDPAA